MTAHPSMLAVQPGLFTALPFGAQDMTMLNHFAGGLKKAEGTQLVSAATAGFTDAGWSRRGAADVSVVFHDGGKICDVSSETIPTDGAISALQIVAGGSGLPLESIHTPEGCDAYQLGATASVVISSTGQDPSCSASPTSALRFTFADTM